jgi:splicing factor 3A subunit 1
VVGNLKRLASQRSDVFDSTALQGIPDPEEEARKKRMAYEGIPGAGPMQHQQPPPVGPVGGPHNPQNMNIEEQIRHLHERYKQ